MSQLVERAIDAAGLGSVLTARREAASMDAHVARLRAADLLVLGALADRVRVEEVGAAVRIYMNAPPSGDMNAPPSGDMNAPPGDTQPPPSGDMNAPPGDTQPPPSGDTSPPPGGAMNARGPRGPVTVLPGEGQELAGLDLLREVAVARITGPRGARVRVDWTRCGLELAQVALGFGADELVGFIATKRGLPIADGELAGVGKKSKRELAQIVKRKELAACVERGGRVAVFIRADGAVETAERVAEEADESEGVVEAEGAESRVAGASGAESRVDEVERAQALKEAM